jgi:effector-binding domain-containing protein
MAVEVHLERVEPRNLAAIRTTTSRAELSAAIYRALDAVWPVLREQGVRTDHNVVVYHGGDESTLDVEIGVEVFGPLVEKGDVRQTTTPAGEVAMATHVGDYGEMAPTYAAIDAWCEANGRRGAGQSWEVYGDWHDDPAQRLTDIHVLLTPV